jgi:hypothetical protein
MASEETAASVEAGAPAQDTAPGGNAAPEEKRKARRKIPARQILLIGGAFIVGFIIFGVIAIQVWEYSNSVTFCANACHDVHPEEIPAFEDSFHANVKCTECHMGRVGTIESIFRKASHVRHLPEVIFDQYDRPIESESMRPANESCELCHWPPAFHGDTVRRITRYEPDEENTEKNTYLILKTGAGERQEANSQGIHWHISNPVEYIATDHRKQDIPWIRTTLPDGRTVEYNDIVNPLTPEEIASAEKKTMDCVDCHNRVGHPFYPPEDLTDASLESGHLSRDLPYAKEEMYNLLSYDFANREEALDTPAKVRERYEEDHPEAAAAYPDEIGAAEELARTLLNRLVFDEPGVTWKSFPDNNKHKDFPGCFRCHDGNHQSDDGEAIRLQCNLCHSVPASVGEGDRPPQLPLAYIQEPESHLESSWMAEHRFQANGNCETCHGAIEFGADDSSFCANSSCHGTAWPMVELDANFEHPIELTGKHAETWCHDCHEGVRKPEFECVNCHEPPEAHFGPVCEDCHTPEGFEGADMGDFEHPVALEGAHASAECSDCHVSGQELTADCSGCHQPPDGHFGPDCQDCHTPTSFGDASLPADQHPVPLEGAHQTAACDGCHSDGQEKPSTVCSDCHEAPENHLPGECDACHTPEGFADSASVLVSTAPEITHDLQGRDDCLQCHDPNGNIKPAPANHEEYANEQCTLCHKLAE